MREQVRMRVKVREEWRDTSAEAHLSDVRPGMEGSIQARMDALSASSFLFSRLSGQADEPK